MVSKEEIPEHWDIQKMEDIIAHIKTGSTPKRSEKENWGGRYNWAKAEEISSAEKYIQNTEESISEKGLDNSSVTMFDESYVFLTIIGAKLGSVVLPKSKMGVNQQNVGIRPNSAVLREFLYYYLISIETELKEQGRGGGQNAINQSVVKEQNIPVPPLEEQEMIVEKLDEIFDSIEEIQDAQEQAEEVEDKILQSIIKNWVGRKSEEENWPEKKLDEIAQFQNGYSFSKSDWEDQGLPIIRIQNLTGSNDELNYYDGEIEEKYHIEDGDLLLSWSATLDVFRWNRGHALLNQHIYNVKPYTAEKQFLFYLFKWIINDLESLTHGSTMKHITKKKLLNIEVPIPPVERQREIADKMDSFSESISMIREGEKNVNEVIEDLPKSVLAEAFKGDLVDFEPEESSENEENVESEAVSEEEPDEASDRSFDGDSQQGLDKF